MGWPTAAPATSSGAFVNNFQTVGKLSFIFSHANEHPRVSSLLIGRMRFLDNSGLEPALWALKMTGGQQAWVGVPGIER